MPTRTLTPGSTLRHLNKIYNGTRRYPLSAQSWPTKKNAPNGRLALETYHDRSPTYSQGGTTLYIVHVDGYNDNFRKANIQAEAAAAEDREKENITPNKILFYRTKQKLAFYTPKKKVFIGTLPSPFLRSD